MTSKRLFYVLSGLFALGLLATFGGAYYGKQVLNAKSQALIELKAKSNALTSQEQALVKAKRDLKQYEELESVTATIVPKDKDQARTVREIIKFAEESGVSIANISFPASELGSAKTQAVPGTEQSPAQPSTAPTTTQVEAVKGIPGLYKLDIVIQSAGSSVPYQNFLHFLRRLENNRRTAHVTSVTVQPDTADRGQVTFSLIMSVFIKP